MEVEIATVYGAGQSKQELVNIKGPLLSISIQVQKSTDMYKHLLRQYRDSKQGFRVSMCAPVSREQCLTINPGSMRIA